MAQSLNDYPALLLLIAVGSLFCNVLILVVVSFLVCRGSKDYVPHSTQGVTRKAIRFLPSNVGQASSSMDTDYANII